jgi:hypothetical protein
MMHSKSRYLFRLSILRVVVVFIASTTLWSDAALSKTDEATGEALYTASMGGVLTVLTDQNRRNLNDELTQTSFGWVVPLKRGLAPSLRFLTRYHALEAGIAPSTLNKHRIKFGARLGLSSVSVKGDTTVHGLYQSAERVEEQRFKLGMSIALFAFIRLNSMISLQPEIGISTKGFSGIYYNGGHGWNRHREDITVTSTYFEFPILVKVSPINTKLRPSLFVGPALGIRLSTSVNSNLNRVSYIYPPDRFKSKDVGLVLGGSLLIGNSPFSLDARYTLGLSWIGDNGDTDGYEFTYDNLRNRSFSVSLGVILPR